ncbi:recombination mediator RecR [Acetobacteroides hydrogenigenes]|uniref:Recombination protein RecR n=1 Tax=Acetobacteroides hydrogenigenes TaxID=979970 RepID=A0A4R2EV31_9BACT|nr:recombination mediator RecR [Acetobacteroides hydrogenigenes]TCN70664.1 DNA replication and repair protein RecR [Acetobacteroides hydrogenigenes]
MNSQEYPSRLLENAINELAKLPGIGKKTALRLVLHMIKWSNEEVEQFGTSFITLKNEVKRCKVCHNISDNETCDICSNTSRDNGIICVVENIRDVMSIEHTHQFNGLYHVLGGLISPMDGIGPADLTISSLIERIGSGEIKEVILALSTNMEGETTNFYIYRKIKDFPISISTIARGVGFGDELEYTDEITLGRSIKNRMPFEKTFGDNH